MEMARASGKRRRAAKAKRAGSKEYVTPLPKRKSPAQAKEFGARIPVGSRSPATKAQTPKRKIPAGARSFRKAAPTKAGVAPRTTRTPAQRAAAKKALLKEQKAARKESAGMRYGSEYKKPPKLGKKDTEGMEEAMKFGGGGGLIKAGIAAAIAAAGLKGHKMYKLKKAADLVKSPRRGSGLQGGKPPATPKPKPKPKKKKSKAQIKKESMIGASQWR